MQNINSGKLKGIDISNWDGTVDFDKVKKDDIDVVYIKATEGNFFVSPTFKIQYAGAKAARLSIGFYHLFRPSTEEDALSQAEHFCSTINGKSYNCKLALDLEVNNKLDKDTLSKLADIFLKEVKKLTGKEVVIYTYTNFAKFNLTTLLSSYPVWIADYKTTTPASNPIWDSWIGFQYSDSGLVKGINGYCNLNVFTNEILLNRHRKQGTNQLI